MKAPSIYNMNKVGQGSYQCSPHTPKAISKIDLATSDNQIMTQINLTKVLLLPLVPKGVHGTPKKITFQTEFCSIYVCIIKKS